MTSRRWQLDAATELVADRGRIVAQFFDVCYWLKVTSFTSTAVS